MIDNEDDRPLDPAAALALVATQQSEFERRQARLVPWILLVWGVAWLVGFLGLWAVDALRPAFAFPLPAAIILFAALMAGGGAASGVLGSRIGHGFRSTPGARFTGAVFGITCSAGFAGIYLFGVALVRQGMPSEVANVFYPVAFTGFIGLMYVMAGAIWKVTATVVLGGWIVVVALIASFVGYPHHYLLFAIAGGGAFLVGAVALLLWVRMGRPR